MRAAPPVSLSCCGGLPWRLLRTLLPALAAAAAAASLLGHAEMPGPAWLAVFVLVAGVAWRASRPQAVALQWDGQTWRLDGTAGQIEVMIDPGPALLLRFKPLQRGPLRWLAVTAAEAGPAWHGLRTAVYARSPAASASARTRAARRAAD